MANSLNTIKTSTTVHTDPALVYSVITDFSNYQGWNPWITEAEGICSLDTEVMARHGGFGTVKHRLTELVAPEKIRWELSGWQRHCISATREILVYPGIENNTLVTLKVILSGPLLPLALLLFRRGIKKGMNEEIKALKLYCEQQSANKSDR